MRRLSPDFIEKVRLANDIIDIIGEDTFLRRSGIRYMGLCPFPSHNEKTPSFSVSPDRQLYYCFGCGQSGNIFTYLREKRGLHFPEAVHLLTQRAGLSLPFSEQIENDSSYKQRKKLLEINLSALEFYEKNLESLKASHPVKQYLKQRELSDETLKKFRLGYAPDNWTGLLSHLKKKGANIGLSMELGLIKKNKKYYDFFYERLIFPVFAKNGREILGFGGRSLMKENQAKYINSQESSIFHKGRIFYGWENAISAIREHEKALVVEGYTDYLSLYQRGVKNVVATLGTSLTTEQARWLSQYTDVVILCFDGDKAGKKATQRSLNILLSFGLRVKNLTLEEGSDPDSFIREKGKKLFCKKLDSAQDLFWQIYLEELKKYPPGMDRFALIQKMANILAEAKKGVLRDYYIQRFLDSFGSDEDLAQKALEQALKRKKYLLQKGPSFWNKNKTEPVKTNEPIKLWEWSQKKALQGEISSTEPKKQAISLKSAYKPELYLLILALENPKHYKEILESGVIEKISDSRVKHLFNRLEEYRLEEYEIEELEYFSALTDILSADLERPKDLQKDSYPALKSVTGEKVRPFIHDCLDRIEKKNKHLNLKSITANMRSDQENTKHYLQKVIEWAKKSKKLEKEHEQ